MSPKRAAFLNIVVAIFFAAAIILADIVFEGTEHNETVKYSLIALWWMPFSYLSSCIGCPRKHC